MPLLYTRQDVAISLPQSSRSRSTAQTRSNVQTCRTYRLVDQQGDHHPILDELYDSLDAAWSEALNWWRRSSAPSRVPSASAWR